MNQKPLILSVEDSVETQNTLKGLFSELGCEVKVAASGEEAVELLKNGLMPDVIILDFKLPGMSGPQFFRSISMDPKLKDIPVVPFTSQWNKKAEGNTLAGQWLAASYSQQKVNKIQNIEGVVAKGLGESVSTVPEELVLSVGAALVKRNVPVSDVFRKVVEVLGVQNKV
jgi:CheY-like chemotaxis protein